MMDTGNETNLVKARVQTCLISDGLLVRMFKTEACFVIFGQHSIESARLSRNKLRIYCFIITFTTVGTWNISQSLFLKL